MRVPFETLHGVRTAALQTTGMLEPRAGTRTALGFRSGTAVAANYRASGRARSAKEFCSKIAIVMEEADESQLWLELLPEADPTVLTDAHKALPAEASELTAIFTATYRTAKSNLKKRKEHGKGRAK